MENHLQSKRVYLHYDHTDACKNSRWTARECYEFMYGRPWQQVLDYYSNVVNGRMSLSALFPTEHRELSPQMHSVCKDGEIVEASEKSESASVPTKDRSGRWARLTFKIVLSYLGGSFDGWQKQPGLTTVQGLVEGSLGRFVDEQKANQLKDKGSPIEGAVVVAGRTDKGVTALQQVCSFYTWRKDVRPEDIMDAINEAASVKLRVISVAEVSRVFHPNFCAKWRRYLYIFPLNDGEEGDVENINSRENYGSRRYKFAEHIGEETIDDLLDNDEDRLESPTKPMRFKISKVNQLLYQLEGKLLSYQMFARDTKASRNVGPPTECFVYHARAAEARLPPSAKDDEGTKAMCVELVANRFLRKMVRVIVATAVREAAAGAEEDALLKLMGATCRRATAPPAPPDGLCLVDVGYTEFDPKICQISLGREVCN